MYTKIEPVVYRKGQANCLIIRNISVQLGERAVVEWSMMGDNKQEYESGGIQLTGDEYIRWGTDDSYVYSWLATQLNLNIASYETHNYWAMPEPLVTAVVVNPLV